MAEKANQRGRHGDLRHPYTPGWKVGVKHADGSVLDGSRTKNISELAWVGFSGT